MKNYIVIYILLLAPFIGEAQWCSQPNPNFCPGNFFQNGDFEQITGNPSAQGAADIGLATGWQAMWTGNNNTMADLACGGTRHNNGNANFVPPIPNSGVYAGIWVENTANINQNNNFREGMYNRLNTPIAQNNATYTFSFNMANGMPNINSGPVRIGIYGVWNPANSTATAPTGLYMPSNINLWQSVDPTVQVVQLGVITTPAAFTNTWIPQTVSFNASILPTNGITHIMIAHEDALGTGYSKLYVNFDEFCLQQTTPPVADCCQTPLKFRNSGIAVIQNATINGVNLSQTTQTFMINSNSSIPIVDFRVAVTDIVFDYNYEQCAQCVDNPALWGSITSQSAQIGSGLQQKSLPYHSGNLTTGRGNLREVIWSNANGVMLQQGNTFDITYWLPPLSEIPCCVTKVTICQEISWKDANCQVCTENICTEITLVKSAQNQG